MFVDAALKLHRIVEFQAHTVIRGVTETQEEYEFVENLIESLKPKPLETDHHYLIKTPFRYPLPVPPLYAGRFKPPFHDRNGFYGTREFRTAAFEYGYHWLRQRVHVPGLSQTPEPRTNFQVAFHDPECLDIRKDPDGDALMDRKDYGPSHAFIRKHPGVRSLLYPSCRDPQKGDCVVTFAIQTLGRMPEKERTFYLVYDGRKKVCTFEDTLERTAPLRVAWEEVN